MRAPRRRADERTAYEMRQATHGAVAAIIKSFIDHNKLDADEIAAYRDDLIGKEADFQGEDWIMIRALVSDRVEPSEREHVVSRTQYMLGAKFCFDDLATEGEPH